MNLYRKEVKRLRIDTSGVAIQNLRIHDLRHTVGSSLAATGANTALTMQALGHRTAVASLIYQKMHSDPIRDAMQKATARILQQGGVRTKATVTPLTVAK